MQGHGKPTQTGKIYIIMSSIKWFERKFNSNGVTSVNDKIQDIVEEGRPENIEDILSLMACQYNAKFAFDNQSLVSYEEVTAPLRKLLEKDTEYKWTDIEEESYVKLMEIIRDPDTLQAFRKDRKINLVLIFLSLRKA